MMRFLLVLIFTAAAVAAAPPEPKFRRQVIDDKIQIGYGVAAADVDGDKKIDILLADKRQFAWYRNPTWEKFIIAEKLTQRDNVCLAAQDIDGDGKCELAVGGDWDPNDREKSGAVLYMIAPADRTQKWEPVKLHAEPTVHRMRWMQLHDDTWSLVVVPLHGRGKDGAAGSRILRYQKPANPRDEWKTELLEDGMHATHNFDVVASADVLIAGREGVREVAYVSGPPWMRWWKVQAGKASGFRGAGEVRFARRFVQAEAKPVLVTIEPMHGNELVAYMDDTRMLVSDKLVEGHALACGDLLGLDDDQIIVGWRGGGGGVRMYTWNPAAFAQWRETVVDDKGMACEDVCLADLDGDGKLDIVASGRSTRNVVIYWNQTPAAPATSPATALGR